MSRPATMRVMKSGSAARSAATALAILGLLVSHSGGAAAPAAAAAPPAKTAAPGGCLPTGNGYLRARIRGNVNVDLDWRDSQIECHGGPRPDGSGVRVSFAGPLHADGRRVRLVFGLESAQEGKPGRELPTNLTVIFEGDQRLFATRGGEHCTVDDLRQERVGALGGARRAWRIVARGFCVAPASTLASDARIVVSTFDFAGRAVFEDETP